MERLARTAFISSLSIIAIASITIFLKLGSLPFVGPDEPRYARIAEEMCLAHRWVTPLLQNSPWLEKPPFYYWITIPLYTVFGVSETTARLGSAFLALSSALSVLWLGSRLWNRTTGLLGAAILVTSIGYCGFGRAASTDMPMTACLTICLAILGVAAFKEDLAYWKILAAYVFLGLAILSKGPVALVLALGVAVLFWALQPGWRLNRWTPALGLGITALVSFPWFWLAFRQNGFSFISVFFIDHNLLRYVSDLHHHRQPVYYYLPVLIGLLFPWSGWLPALTPRAGVKKTIRAWRTLDPRIIYLAGWFCIPTLFFSLSTSKLPGYVLPALPPAALLLGRAFEVRIRTAAVSQSAATHFVYGALSTAVAVTAPFVSASHFGGDWKPGLWLSAAVFLPAIFAFTFGRKGSWSAAFKATLIQSLAIVVAVTAFAFPPAAKFDSARDISRKVLSLRSAAEEPIATYRLVDHTLNYYTGYRLSADLPDPDVVARFSQQNSAFLVVTEIRHLSELRGLPVVVEMLGYEGRLCVLRVRREAYKL